MLGGELRLALLVENADAKYRGLAPSISGQTRLELARLLRAAWRVVLRVEVKHHVLSGVVRQPMRVAVLIFQCEGRSFLSGFDERHRVDDNTSDGTTHRDHRGWSRAFVRRARHGIDVRCRETAR